MNPILSIAKDFIQTKDFSKMCLLQGLCTRDEFQKAVYDKRWECVGKMMQLGLDEYPARAILQDMEDEKEEIL